MTPIDFYTECKRMKRLIYCPFPIGCSPQRTQIKWITAKTCFSFAERLFMGTLRMTCAIRIRRAVDEKYYVWRECSIYALNAHNRVAGMVGILHVTSSAQTLGYITFRAQSSWAQTQRSCALHSEYANDRRNTVQSFNYVCLILKWFFDAQNARRAHTFTWPRQV